MDSFRQFCSVYWIMPLTRCFVAAVLLQS
ncbi:hypothetical protein PENSTE_c001G09810 [Penicillium steckii]|uniref:Uncharacterized protein n=1 Tax=Penicillium steckii TaxID=303698 RepID=A0A1V6U2Y9_9EURO|nr:hypothetical protein PENSTE_c001G09810 [Penicillium steckii]